MIHAFYHTSRPTAAKHLNSYIQISSNAEIGLSKLAGQSTSKVIKFDISPGGTRSNDSRLAFPATLCFSIQSFFWPPFKY